ncbi:hypothetical protein CEQ15_11485 [Chryseobacterium indologenes]|uniref:hypothetical protein n=1 Tax=Chryseobacterium indologenes TaxID=253 RepID=UPI000B518FF6|nr:hypothetical protein [Chryseobacterium indologenes]ASE62069.1 hypothetical protein CEQ15_11485 [Chryseobacterium indologenes]
MEEILNELKLSNELISLFKGEIPIFDKFSMYKFYINEAKTNSLPFPPFLIPFAYSYDADHYHMGLVKHWFSARAISYGDMTDATEFETTEIARNERQLFTKLLFEEFVNNEDCVVTDRMIKCRELMGLSDLDFETLKEINNRDTDNTACDLPFFREKSPLNCVNDIGSYDGDFPSDNKFIVPRNIDSASYFEISHKEWIGYNVGKKGFSFFKKESKFTPLDTIPEWLKPETDKKELFEKYLHNSQLDKAWLTINGPGFNPKEVGERLQHLKEFSTDRTFHLWADFWCERYGNMDSFIFI